MRRFILAAANGLLFILTVMAPVAMMEATNLKTFLIGAGILALLPTLIDGVNGRVPLTPRTVIYHFLTENFIIYFDIIFVVIIFPFVLLEALSALAWVLWLVMLIIIGIWLLQWIGVLAETVAPYDRGIWWIFGGITAGQIIYYLVNRQLAKGEKTLMAYCQQVEKVVTDKIYLWREQHYS